MDDRPVPGCEGTYHAPTLGGVIPYTHPTWATGMRTCSGLVAPTTMPPYVTGPQAPYTPQRGATPAFEFDAPSTLGGVLVARIQGARLLRGHQWPMTMGFRGEPPNCFPVVLYGVV